MGTGSRSFNSPAGKNWEVPLAGTHFVCRISETREGQLRQLPHCFSRENQASALLLGSSVLGTTRCWGGTAIPGGFLQRCTRFCSLFLPRFLPGARVGWPEHTDPSPARKEEPWELRQQNPSSFPGQKWGLGWDDMFPPVSNSTLGMLPAGIEHRRRDHPWIGIEPPSPAPARWFSLQPLTHLPKIPALTSWQETATGKW